MLRLLEANVPAPQALQAIWPLSEVEKPGAHGEHWVMPVALANVPTGQLSQKLAPCAAAYVPVGHCLHVLLPVASW